jgi:hypothetical protein
MLLENLTLTNQMMEEYQFISLQLSYSTADIEKGIFYEPEHTPVNLGEPLGKAKMMVIHGDVFTLEEGPIPQPSTPLTEKSGLFKIIKLVEEPVP